jgi:hypothetical protein
MRVGKNRQVMSRGCNGKKKADEMITKVLYRPRPTYSKAKL